MVKAGKMPGEAVAFSARKRTIRHMPNKPLPHAPSQLIATPEALATVCQHLRAAGTFAFDTEFIGENTYQPILCLIQVATRERVELIDPMAISREGMRPFWDLLADESLEKICHAGDQDVEIVWQHSGHLTRNMFDTQIGAGMLGISYPTALWRAVEHFTGVTLEKAHTYSAWDRRPLSKAQFTYAVDDVRYLPGIHAAMKAKLEELGHLHWMRAACDEMCAEAARPTDVRKLFTKIRGAPGLDSEGLSVLREVAALREAIAFEHDVPARAFIKDEVLLEIATRLPRSTAELAKIRDMPPEEAESYGPAFLEAVATGLAVDEKDRPTIFIPGEDSAEVKRIGEHLWVAAQAICLGQSVTPGLVTSQSEIMAIARTMQKKQSFDKHPLMTGWHRECLGEKLAAFVRGELKVDLTMVDGGLRAAFSSNARTPS
jgi:ribonuclease D